MQKTTFLRRFWDWVFFQNVTFMFDLAIWLYASPLQSNLIIHFHLILIRYFNHNRKLFLLCTCLYFKVTFIFINKFSSSSLFMGVWFLNIPLAYWVTLYQLTQWTSGRSRVCYSVNVIARKRGFVLFHKDPYTRQGN